MGFIDFKKIWKKLFFKILLPYRGFNVENQIIF